MKFHISSLSFLLLAAPLTSAATTIIGETTDAILSSDTAGAQGGGLSVINSGNTQIRVGNWNSGSGKNFAIAYVFELPDLGALVNPFSNATLTFELNAIQNSPSYNADLYGIDARAASNLITGDFYVGDATDPNATKLQDSILTSSTSTGSVVSVDISSYLNTQYDGGANIGEFVFLRLNRDGSTDIFDQQSGYLVATADASTNQPFLTYTAVPEPSSTALLGLGATALLLRRRK